MRNRLRHRLKKWRLPRLRPRSVRDLLLAGYLVVSLPLIIASVVSVLYVDRLSDQSERLVKQGVEATRLSQSLLEDITAMERNARQYAVLDNPILKKRFQDHYQNLQSTISTFSMLELASVLNRDLKSLRHQAAKVVNTIKTHPDSAAESGALRSSFARLYQTAHQIGDQSNAFIDSELARIQATSKELRWFLILAGFTLVPTTMLLVGLFTFVISRPIRQIDRAIRRLGQSDFSEPVAVNAPSAELDALGNRLDWMRRRLQQLESEKNQFLQHMSHELKTPLASIREGAELLRDGTLEHDSDTQTEVVNILHHNSQELTALIDNLLDFATWQRQQARVAREHIQLHELATHVAARHHLSIEKCNLNVELPDDSVYIDADPDRLRLILDNLIANAVKFSPAGGTIRIVGTENRHNTVIEISDEGPGIDENEHEHVFTAFYQAHADMGTHIKGTGIGLSVVRDSVHAHDGTIEILSSEIGACYRIVIPEGGTQ